MLKTSDFDFNLPSELIAQTPFFPKEKTKMLVWRDSKILDAQLINLTDFLQEGDVLVFNDARVIKAKLQAKILRNSAILDFNLDQEIEGKWSALCRPAKKVQVGDSLQIAEDFFAEVIEKTDDGFIKIKFDCADDELRYKLDKYGAVPLPPYIKRTPFDETASSRSLSLSKRVETPSVNTLRQAQRTAETGSANGSDETNYQTIYAANGTAVAAPTAGLHFNENIFARLDAKKIQKTFVTLNVGAGTFLPVRADFLKDHKMHRESFSISKETAEIINSAKKQGKKIIAVGTTSLRVLESCTNAEGLVEPMSTHTEIFIHPPYKFKIVDVLMTNFHLPKSTLFMLVSAFIGKENAQSLYNHAISKNYRFYSYGDTSLLFPEK
jgi:S-adenosylmethionine:tRNA ribosyltransferase-isomerase